jgi:hypothetical protein
MSDDWARRTAEKIRESEEQRKRDVDSQEERRRLLKTQVPQMWEHLTRELEEKAASINALMPEGQPHFSVKSLPGDVPHVEIESPKGQLDVSHLGALNVITISRPATPDPLDFSASIREPKKEIKESWHFEVVEGEVWIQTEDKKNLSVTDAAERILEMLA